MGKKIIILISLLTVILIVTGCTPKPQLQSSFISSIKHPQKVALLVPLHGVLTGSGEAIRNGFLAAYYYSLQHEQSDLSIKVIDTSQDDVTTLYQQAVTDGAEFIVGPLTKQNVQVIANMDSLPVTTLALNTIDDYTKFNVPNLYQFGLSTRDEAIQVATRAWQEHSGHAIIIVPNSVWGQSIANVLQDTWQSFGGIVATTLLYNYQISLNKQVQHTLNIDLSQNDAKSLQKIIWKKFKFIPRPRQDIDVIFLIAQPKQARQIRPLLQFYFAGNLPIYSTSIIYTGIPQPNLDHDLNGIIFCDMPWLLQKPTSSDVLSTLHNEINELWPYSYKRYTRLYALGIDSYYLMLNLDKLLKNPHTGIAGATGIFYIDDHRHIYRKLDWAKMQNGVPNLL